MLEQITFYNIFGVPLIAYGGMLALVCLLFTAAVPILNQKGINKIPMKWHFIMAKATLALALIHGTLGILAFF
jgi:hypothetical protein